MNAMRKGELERRGRRYRWYVEPKNQHTNESICMMSSEENIYPGRVCSDGHPHDLFETTRPYVDFLIRSRRTQPALDFRVWVQEGDGMVRRWYLEKKSARVRKVIGNKKPSRGTVTVSHR